MNMEDVKWIKTAPLTYTNWATPEPSDTSGCTVGILPSSHEWATVDCNNENLALCQKLVRKIYFLLHIGIYPFLHTNMKSNIHYSVAILPRTGGTVLLWLVHGGPGSLLGRSGLFFPFICNPFDVCPALEV